MSRASRRSPADLLGRDRRHGGRRVARRTHGFALGPIVLGAGLSRARRGDSRRCSSAVSRCCARAGVRASCASAALPSPCRRAGNWADWAVVTLIDVLAASGGTVRAVAGAWRSASPIFFLAYVARHRIRPTHPRPRRARRVRGGDAGDAAERSSRDIRRSAAVSPALLPAAVARRGRDHRGGARASDCASRSAPGLSLLDRAGRAMAPAAVTVAGVRRRVHPARVGRAAGGQEPADQPRRHRAAAVHRRIAPRRQPDRHRFAAGRARRSTRGCRAASRSRGCYSSAARSSR